MKSFREINREALSLLTALVLMVTPVLAHAENGLQGDINETKISTALPNEEETVEENRQITYDEFMNRCDEIKNLVKKQSKLKIFFDSVEEMYYCSNYMLCKDIRQALIDEGLVYENDEFESSIKLDNFCFNMVSEVCKAIEKNKNITIDKLFHISVFYEEGETKDLAHEAFVKFFELYKNATIDSDSYNECLEILDKLKEKNAAIAVYYYGLLESRLYARCIFKNFKKNELKKYFNNTNSFETMEINDSTWEWYYGYPEPENELEKLIVLLIEAFDTSRYYESFYYNMQQEISRYSKGI